MANCKDDFLEETKNKNVLCAEISYGCDNVEDGRKKKAILPIGYSAVEMQNFLRAINYEYDAGHGNKEVFGTIWYTDGTWSERGEYEGAEWWKYKSCPQIPDEMTGKYSAIIGSDGKHCVDGPGSGFGYYGGTLWPHLRLSSKEDAEAAATLCNKAYERGYRKCQADMRAALGVETQQQN